MTNSITADFLGIDATEAILSYFERNGIYPNTLILNDADLRRMSHAVAKALPLAIKGELQTLFGLQVIGSAGVQSGTCALANMMLFGADVVPF